MKDAVTVVTSCSLSGWEQYGYKALMSMGLHWPKKAEYFFVSENTMPSDMLSNVKKHLPLTVLNLLDYKKAHDFYDRHKADAKVFGRHHSTRSGYNFRRDAWKFSKKVFAISMVTNNRPYGRLIWLDADTLTHRPVPMELLHRLPPDDFHIAYLDRSKLRYHSECGFVAYNLNHVETLEFITYFTNLYATDEVFKLSEWHDSWVFDYARAQTKVRGWPIPYTDIRHPFNYSELGKYMDHLKGNRKNLGVSTEHPRYIRKKG
jgi:hypothetical protein